MDETELPIFSKFSVFIFLDDAVVSTHTVSCKYALLFDLEVSKGVSDLAPLCQIAYSFVCFWNVSNI